MLGEIEREIQGFDQNSRTVCSSITEKMGIAYERCRCMDAKI